MRPLQLRVLLLLIAEAAALAGHVPAFAADVCAEQIAGSLAELAFPTPEEIDRRLPAIHLTDFFPQNDTIAAASEGRGRFGGTVHFALGDPVLDHPFGKWSEKPYGVLVPFGQLKDQLLNLNPLDSFVLAQGVASSK